MFGIIADLIASITTILLPAYLSFKALRTHDPAQTHPWLIYFTILSLSLLFESWTVFIIGWMPFYSWIRLFFLLYLVLPQTQGAKILYLDYLEPYIVEHEARIDRFIGETHDKLQKMGMGYLNILIEYIRDRVLGQKSPQPPTQQTGYGSYAQDLLSRFAMPAARTSGPNTSAAGVYSAISGLAGAAMASGRSRDVSAASEASTIPDSLVSEVRSQPSSDKSSMISAQRERLTKILKALETEQQNIDLAYGQSASSGGGLKTKSRSEASFEQVDYDDARHDEPHNTAAPAYPSASRTQSGSWIPSGVSGWLGSGGGAANSKKSDERDDRASKGWNAARDITEAMAQGMSSGFDRGK